MMKNKLNTILLLSMMLMTVLMPIRADLEVPGETDPLLAEIVFEIAGKTFTACKELRENSVYVKILGAAGQEIVRSESLGEQEKLFVLGEKALALAALDLNNDNLPEIIVPAMTGPDRSALYVFKFDVEGKKLIPFKFTYKNEKLERDFLVSDFYQQNGQDLVFLEKNRIRVLGKIYQEGAEPVVGFYFFDLATDSFVCNEILPVPED
jgi:hypothetical protein